MPRMFVPGPVDVADEVLQAQAAPMLPHRSKEFEAIYRRTSEKSQQLFYTNYRVFLTASSGTGLQEAAIRNFVDTRVLSIVNGAFADRWYEVAVSNGKDAEKLSFEWDVPASPDRIADALRKGGFEALTIVHNETSTGLQNPVKEIAEAVRVLSPDTLICVDAVSSLAGAKIEMDAWGLDMVLTSSQKCLALPPGLALGAVGALEKRGTALEWTASGRRARILDSVMASLGPDRVAAAMAAGAALDGDAVIELITRQI